MVQSQVPPESNCGGLDNLFNISWPQFLRVNNPFRFVALYPHIGITRVMSLFSTNEVRVKTKRKFFSVP